MKLVAVGRGWGEGEMGRGGDGERGRWGEGDKENYQLPMPNAQCPMPNAQCPITNYQFKYCKNPTTVSAVGYLSTFELKSKKSHIV